MKDYAFEIPLFFKWSGKRPIFAIQYLTQVLLLFSWLDLWVTILKYLKTQFNQIAQNQIIGLRWGMYSVCARETKWKDHLKGAFPLTSNVLLNTKQFIWKWS